MEKGCWSSLILLTLTTFLYLSQFIKACKFSRNDLKLFTNDPISLGWWKNMLCITHGSPYCFYRVSKILAECIPIMLSLWCLCWFGNSSYWIRITWNFVHITVSVYRHEKVMYGQLVIQSYGFNFNHILLFVSIYESLQILTKSLETFHKWPNKSRLTKKNSLY